jgi:hypothetical protein
MMMMMIIIIITIATNFIPTVSKVECRSYQRVLNQFHASVNATI